MIDKRIKKYCKTISVLGQKYKIKFKAEEDGPDGRIRFVSKEIIINDLYDSSRWKDNTDKAIDFQIKETMRHEILHAFFFESGLDANSNSISCWARNEEMIDWFAIQSPKIFKIYKDLKCL